MGLPIPANLEYALGFIGGSFVYPQGDEDQLFDMADAYFDAASGLRAAGGAVSHGSQSLQAVIVGEVHDAMKKYFDDIAGPEGLEGLADNFQKCGWLCNTTATSVLVAKVAYGATIAIFLVQLASALAEAPFTAGGSLAQVPIEAAIAGGSLRLIIKTLVDAIIQAIKAAALKVIQKEMLLEIGEEVAKSVVQAGAKELTKELIAGQFFGPGVDGTKLAKEMLKAGGEAAIGKATEVGVGGALGAHTTPGSHRNSRHGEGDPHPGPDGDTDQTQHGDPHRDSDQTGDPEGNPSPVVGPSGGGRSGARRHTGQQDGTESTQHSDNEPQPPETEEPPQPSEDHADPHGGPPDQATPGDPSGEGEPIQGQVIPGPTPTEQSPTMAELNAKLDGEAGKYIYNQALKSDPEAVPPQSSTLAQPAYSTIGIATAVTDGVPEASGPSDPAGAQPGAPAESRADEVINPPGSGTPRLNMDTSGERATS